MKYYTRIIRKYKPGDLIVSENSDCDGMYIIDSGRVRVFKTVGEKEEIDLCTLGPKAMFGEMAMIDNCKRSASVQAIEPTSCTVITRKIFEDQLSRIPIWMISMIRVLVTRIRETNERLREVVEEHSNIPDNDTGRVITVDTQDMLQSGICSTEKGKQNPAMVKPDDIIEDLFSSDGPRKNSDES